MSELGAMTGSAPRHAKYPHLLQPLEVAGMRMPNRSIMGSMHMGLEEEPGGFTKLAQFYAERAEGGAGLIVTGGISPNRAGKLAPHGAALMRSSQAAKHREVTGAVHASGGRIALQILHGGRYSYHPFCVAPSKGKAPISKFSPWALSGRGVERTIRAYVRCAVLAREAGYDGVEIMGSEGYLINQFLVRRTNHRTDQWGGDFANRVRFPEEIVSRIRQACGPDFAIMYRLSMLDLVEEGNGWGEVVEQAQIIEAAGADIINTGIGWHEARIPTIAAMVPRAGFAWVTKKLMGQVGVPLVTTNRINMPEVAEQVLADGCADLVSMARPWLADGEIIAKAIDGREGEINTCIACNQACLDRTFKGKVAGCVVNPRAGRETEFTKAAPQGLEGRYAVVGGGPAGMSTALELAKRGATVDLYETQEKLGGQFLLAHQIPGKEEFAETLRYYQHELDRHGVRIHLGTRFEPTDVGAAQDKGDPFKAVAWCAGIRPRVPSIPGNDLPIAVPYDKVLTGEVEVGQRVALIGAGGIGFDVADFLSHPHGEETVDGFRKSWGIDGTLEHDGGLIEPQRPSNGRTLYLLQRKEGKPGKGLGKTTGWIHRLTLRFRGVKAIPGVTYKAIEPNGLRIEVGGEEQFLELDTVVFCSGQLSNNEPVDALQTTGIPVTVIGGAKEAYGIDAERAIREGFEWARSL